MQHKDTSQQAFLIIYLMCILSFIYFSLGRSRWVFSQTIRLMSDSEVKTGAFTFCFETLPHRVVCVTSLFLSVSPHSSCLCHLTLLVSHLSLRDKWNLICDVEVCAGLFPGFLSCQESWIYWLITVNNILLPTRNKVSQRGKKLYKNCNPYYNLFCQDIIRLC